METNQKDRVETSDGRQKTDSKPYLLFGSMIITAMVVMYSLTYLNTFQPSHIHWSETRLYMTLIMGAAMALVMLAFMLGMYRNQAANIGIVVVAVVLFGLGTWLVRSQTTVQDSSYMSAMIPHHSIAILTSERSQIEDVRVCELAAAITEAQRREIDEMEWLIADISENGPARTPEEASQRPIPDFVGTSSRQCG